MRAKDFNTGLRGVLFEAKHNARMGAPVQVCATLSEGPTQSRGASGEHAPEPKEFAGRIRSNTACNRERLESRKPAFERSLPKTEPHEPWPPSGGRFARREAREELVRRELQVGAGPEVGRK